MLVHRSTYHAMLANKPSSLSLLVYRLGYGPFKAEGGVRFPGGETFFSLAGREKLP